MDRTRIITCALAFWLMAASAKAGDVKVTFLSDPVGATLYEEVNVFSLKSWGLTPVQLKYKTARRWQSCVSLLPLKVRWVSGAQAAITLQVCPQAGKNQQFVFLRPDGVPGVELDAQFAATVLRNAAIAKAQPEPSVVSEPVIFPTYCTSRVIGNQVFTTCRQ